MTGKTETRVTFLDLLTLVFITLRLCKVIEWSWVWVLFPEWVPLALQIIINVTKEFLKGRKKDGTVL